MFALYKVEADRLERFLQTRFDLFPLNQLNKNLDYFALDYKYLHNYSEAGKLYIYMETKHRANVPGLWHCSKKDPVRCWYVFLNSMAYNSSINHAGSKKQSIDTVLFIVRWLLM